MQNPNITFDFAIFSTFNILPTIDFQTFKTNSPIHKIFNLEDFILLDQKRQ